MQSEYQTGGELQVHKPVGILWKELRRRGMARFNSATRAEEPTSTLSSFTEVLQLLASILTCLPMKYILFLPHLAESDDAVSAQTPPLPAAHTPDSSVPSPTVRSVVRSSVPVRSFPRVAKQHTQPDRVDTRPCVWCGSCVHQTVD